MPPVTFQALAACAVNVYVRCNRGEMGLDVTIPSSSILTLLWRVCAVWMSLVYDYFSPSLMMAPNILAHSYIGSRVWVIHRTTIQACGSSSQTHQITTTNPSPLSSTSIPLFGRHTCFLYLAMSMYHGPFPSQTHLIDLLASMSTNMRTIIHLRLHSNYAPLHIAHLHKPLLHVVHLLNFGSVHWS